MGANLSVEERVYKCAKGGDAAQLQVRSPSDLPKNQKFSLPTVEIYPRI
jgi:hypothetical protein